MHQLWVNKHWVGNPIGVYINQLSRSLIWLFLTYFRGKKSEILKGQVSQFPSIYWSKSECQFMPFCYQIHFKHNVFQGEWILAKHCGISQCSWLHLPMRDDLWEMKSCLEISQLIIAVVFIWSVGSFFILSPIIHAMHSQHWFLLKQIYHDVFKTQVKAM